MPGSPAWSPIPPAMPRNSLSVGLMRDGSSTMCSSRPNRRSPTKPCGGSPRCTRSSPAFAVRPPKNVNACVMNKAGRSSKPCVFGSPTNSAASRVLPAKAIRYALNHWNGLVMFLDDGRLELDTNTVERAIRPVTITRKNSLFAGNDNGGRHWAIIATLVQSAKLNGVEPLAWLTDVLERIVSGRTKRHELETLLPWNWKAAREAEAAETG